MATQTPTPTIEVDLEGIEEAQRQIEVEAKEEFYRAAIAAANGMIPDNMELYRLRIAAQANEGAFTKLVNKIKDRRGLAVTAAEEPAVEADLERNAGDMAAEGQRWEQLQRDHYARLNPLIFERERLLGKQQAIGKAKVELIKTAPQWIKEEREAHTTKQEQLQVELVAAKDEATKWRTDVFEIQHRIAAAENVLHVGKEPGENQKSVELQDRMDRCRSKLQQAELRVSELQQEIDEVVRQRENLNAKSLEVD